MSEWESVRLGDIALVNPKEFLAKKTLATKIGMEHLQPFTKKPNGSSIEPYNGGTKFRNGDILVARITPCLENGKTAYINCLNNGEVGFGSTEYIVLREKLNISYNQFLYYFSRSELFREVAIASMTGSSGRQRVQTDVVINHQFHIPSILEQKAIASVLSSLDDKIDLLHRQNKTLESMAETLFRQWFVEEAQEDWEGKNLLDIVSLVGGGTPKTSVTDYWNGDIPWITGGDISTFHKGCLFSTEKSISSEGLKHSSARLLPKKSTVISARGTVGKYAFLTKEMAFSQSNYGVISKIGDYPHFTYLVVGFIVEQLLSAAYGSVFDTITTRTFESINLKAPNPIEIEKFDNKVKPLFQKKESNTYQLETLKSLRDTLLPKLISGEVRVKYEESQD